MDRLAEGSIVTRTPIVLHSDIDPVRQVRFSFDDVAGDGDPARSHPPSATHIGLHDAGEGGQFVVPVWWASNE